jgi:amino acid adenylation domain-containing protein
MTVVSMDKPKSAFADKRQQLADALRKKARKQIVTAPLSQGQKALWFLYLSAPDSPAYNVSFSARILSRLNVDALRSAFQQLIDRHGALRATFRMQDGVPVQDIAGEREVVFRQTDCSGCDEAQLRRRVEAAYREPFDLMHGPMLRVDLFAIGPDEHVLLLTVHHIAYDAWSLWLNLDEIGQLYAANVAGAASPLPPLRYTYRDYIARNEQMLAGERGQRLWDFWREALAGELTRLNLPIDKPRPLVQTYNGQSYRFSLGAERSVQLRRLAQVMGVTPFVLLLGVFQVLLHRYSGQDEIVVGSPTTGRGDAEFGGVTGYFVNPVVLRADLGDNPAFSAYVERVAQVAVNALEHQDFPFPLLVERLQPPRDPAYAPLFQVSFVYQKPQKSTTSIDWLGWTSQAGRRVTWGGLEIEFFDQSQQEGQFDLELEMLDTGEALIGAFKYNTDLFEQASMARMTRSFEALLDGVIADPTTPVRSLPLLDSDETRKLKQLMPSMPSDPAREHCLHRIFELQAQARPSAIAVTDGDVRMSYSELNARANRLAHYLLRHGVEAETRVAICLQRSWRMIVAMLAVVKAGCAYVPIAPEAPVERNAFILEDSGAALLITSADTASGLADVCPGVIDMEQESDAIDGCPDGDPQMPVAIEQLLYVIYTSGSTGKPKGALVTHFNVARLFASTDRWFSFGNEDVWAMFHSFAFDFSVWEIWGALLYGGRLLLVPYLVSRAPEEFVELLDREGVTVLNQTPSAFRQLIEAEARRPLRANTSLRYVIFGGEALDLKMLESWYARHDDAHPRMINMYGITETTVHVTYRPLCRRDVEVGRSVIGEPIPDLQLHVLDAAMEPVPVGVTGEMFVAGDGLCRGYLNRAELTAERFIVRDLGDGRSIRLYRTGDLARRLDDGDIEYLGRADDQVKIRGFRIELGEIEAAINTHENVASCVAMVWLDDGDKRLVAYVVPEPGTSPSANSLREFLLARLPDYMVPSAFVTIEKIPLNANGKVDRRALPAPQLDRSASTSVFVPPRDPVEQAVVRHWEAVLKLHPISVRDNFFEIGGHSLLAVNLIARLEQEFGRRLPLATLFRRPTVEKLAQSLREQTAPTANPLIVPVQPNGERQAFFCVAGGGGSVLYYYPLALHMGQDRPFLGLQAVGLDGECEPLSSVEALAAVQLEAIRTVQPHGPYLLGGHCFGGSVAFEIAQRLRREGEEVALLVLIDVPARYIESSETAATRDLAGWIAQLAAVIEQSSGVVLDIRENDLRDMNDDARLQVLNARMQAVGAMPPGADVSNVRGLLNVFIANSQARYVPQSVLPVPIALFRAGEHHPDYDFSVADDPGTTLDTSTMGWQAFASRAVDVEVVPGNHITMLSAENAPILAASIVRRLDAVSQASATEAVPRALSTDAKDAFAVI